MIYSPPPVICFTDVLARPILLSLTHSPPCMMPHNTCLVVFQFIPLARFVAWQGRPMLLRVAGEGAHWLPCAVQAMSLPLLLPLPTSRAPCCSLIEVALWIDDACPLDATPAWSTACCHGCVAAVTLGVYAPRLTDPGCAWLTLWPSACCSGWLSAVAGRLAGTERDQPLAGWLVGWMAVHRSK